ncbi:MAG: efflux RND transporter periplasmic adaptor subunit [Pirellulales bacterium]
MSTEQSLDPELIEQTKQQIRELVNEIAQLSKSDVAPGEFYDHFLNRVVPALAAIGGVVWTVGDGGRLELQYQINLRETKLADNQEDQVRHGRLLHQVISSGEGMLVSPHSGAGDDEQAANPTDFLLVLGPLKSDQEVRGVVEVFQRPGGRPSTQRGYLRFLVQMCELAGDYLKTRQLRHFTDRQTLWSQLENFTRGVHTSLDPRETAYTIANEGRRLIECDRVSVAIRKGHKCVIEAISGQDLFDRRSNQVALLQRLAKAVVATGEAVWYTGDTSDMAPQVEEAVQAYVDESHSKTVAVLPLQRPSQSAEGEEHPDDPEKVIGALIVEQIEDARLREGMLQRVEVVRDHSATALANALEHQSLFLMPVWRALGKTRWVFRARTLPKTLAILGAVAVVILALAIVPWDFDLKGNGTLQPVVKREVFAGIDGIVTNIPVKHAQAVRKGQVLAELTNTELEVNLANVEGQIRATEEQIAMNRRLLSSREYRPDVGEQSRLGGEILQLQQKLTSLSDQLALYKQKKELLKVTSPIDGELITWTGQLEMLNHRPVQPGQILMTVADPSGEWEVEVQMPENRMGDIVEAQNELGVDRPVTFILATEPGTHYYGTVKEIHRSAEVRGEEGNTVLIKVKIDKNDLPDLLRPGAGVTAKVDCGRRAVGYVIFHDMIAWIQSRVLFRL